MIQLAKLNFLQVIVLFYMHAPLRMKLLLVWVPLFLMELWLKSTAWLAQDLLLSRIQGFLLERLLSYVLISQASDPVDARAVCT